MHPRLALSLGKFLSESHFYLIIFVIAPFLATLFPADQAGLAVSLGAVVTLLAFPLMPKLVARYGARRLSVAFAGIESLILFLLSDAPSPLIAFILVLGRTYLAKRWTHEQAVTAIVVSYYWHFVDVVWVGLFATIYLLK